MTSKKIVREVKFHSPKGEVETSRTEQKFTFTNENPDVTLEAWLQACDDGAARSIADIYDRKTVVLSDSNGKYFAIQSRDVESATAYVIDDLRI